MALSTLFSGFRCATKTFTTRFATGIRFYQSTATKPASSDFKTILYRVDNQVAYITLNRPERFNAIDEIVPGELQSAVQQANWDKNVKLIVVSGSGKAFCAGYDLKKYAEAPRGPGNPASQEMPWDPYSDYQFAGYAHDCIMSLWRSLKPTIAKINGVCVGGGTDIALSCDATFIAEEAKIGYPPGRLWGCPSTQFWAYRVGMEKAKRLLFTGDVLPGKEAVGIGLVGTAVPLAQLDSEVESFLERLRSVPQNQLFFQKQVINNVFEQMGLFSSQRLSILFDGMTRHTPEGVAFTQRCQEVGFKTAVKERDQGVPAKWNK